MVYDGCKLVLRSIIVIKIRKIYSYTYTKSHEKTKRLLLTRFSCMASNYCVANEGMKYLKRRIQRIEIEISKTEEMYTIRAVTAVSRLVSFTTIHSTSGKYIS